MEACPHILMLLHIAGVQQARFGVIGARDLEVLTTPSPQRLVGAASGPLVPPPQRAGGVAGGTLPPPPQRAGATVGGALPPPDWLTSKSFLPQGDTDPSKTSQGHGQQSLGANGGSLPQAPQRTASESPKSRLPCFDALAQA